MYSLYWVNILAVKVWTPAQLCKASHNDDGKQDNQKTIKSIEISQDNATQATEQVQVWTGLK